MKRGTTTIFNLATLHLLSSSFDLFSLPDLIAFAEQLKGVEWLDPTMDQSAVAKSIAYGAARPSQFDLRELLAN